ncbi:MAG: hypothetical protein HJJLKODD_03011 [Phycisphaerae bacterium]|nr:hypothetical protein [Phycisphaerae bacterium]
MNRELEWAILACCNKYKVGKPYDAAKHLGRALHSIQDWWAHGDFSKGTSDIWYTHSPEYEVKRRFVCKR